ncbi:MAG: DUF1385 domain-containing protein [Eggerthellaceae bacterium]|nr:DUF1385 domain-containing protein [Eggerthellaceae bacterium]
MMRGKYNWSVAVRKPDGSIYLEEHELASGLPKNGWLRKPVVRGVTSFVESLGLGFKALEVAAKNAFDDDGYTYEQICNGEAKKEEPQIEPIVEEMPIAEDKPAIEPEKPVAPSAVASETKAVSEEEKNKESKLFDRVLSVSMIFGILLGIAVFIVVPAVLTNLIVGEYDDKTLLWNVVDGVLRVAVFVFYIWLIGRMKDIRRMFAYHGAEHKVIHCYEHGLPLTPENAAQFPRLHVRCGTAFLIMVMIIAILVYTVLPVNLLIGALGVPDGALKLILVILVRILFLPVIAGLAYEITVKWAGSHPDNFLVKIVLWPGMQMQYLTTNEPDEGMLECAIAAVNAVLAREEGLPAATQGPCL